jgi:glyoxylase-like metal-dependent hydrolase (beta-lactamase superfamily II)
LIDVGVAATADRLLEEAGRYLGEGQGPDIVFLTHAHFDHVGGLPFIRERFPEIEVLGAPATADLLSDEAYVKEVYRKNKECAEAMKAAFDFDEASWCAACRVDRVMGDGDAVELGDDVDIKLISSPGHTADSVSYLVSPDAALAGGEAIGWYGGRDTIANCFADNFSQYLDSLQRLSGLDLKILSFPHSGSVTGELVPKYFMNAQEAALTFRDQVKLRIEQGEMVDEVFAALYGDWQAQNVSPEGPFTSAQTETLRLMIKAAAAA